MLKNLNYVFIVTIYYKFEIHDLYYGIDVSYIYFANYVSLFFTIQFILRVSFLFCTRMIAFL